MHSSQRDRYLIEIHPFVVSGTLHHPHDRLILLIPLLPASQRDPSALVLAVNLPLSIVGPQSSYHDIIMAAMRSVSPRASEPIKALFSAHSAGTLSIAADT
jgi:hypothetical protein